MFDSRITFEYPGYLAVLALLPAVWWLGFRSLASLGPVRRAAVLVLRSLVVVLLALALAEIRMVRTTDDLTVIYLLDQSLSIPQQRREAMIDLVNASIRRQREGKDQVGVIVFGEEAAIEVPPYDDDVQVPPRIETPLDPEYTNLAGAMRLAQASFPAGTSKRVVVVSDGNENVGDALEQAQSLIAAGISIDVMVVRYQIGAEVAVERVTVPNDVRRGQPFDLRVVLTNSKQPTANDDGTVTGTLTVSRRGAGTEAIPEEHRITLGPGKTPLALREPGIQAPDFYTYDVRFKPDDLRDDTMDANNAATAFTHIRGRGQVLVITNPESPGECDLLADRLREQNLEVTVQPSDQTFSSLAQLQPFDTVLLADVPREDFSDDQIAMLVRNTQQMGAGLVMLGGENSFGAGAWTNTELEKAMPVDFQIQNAKIVERGALAMMMHASEIGMGNHWQKVIAREALKALGPYDYCGVIHWNGADQWLWQPGLRKVGGNRDQMLGRIDRMMPGDMPSFDPAMRMVATAFQKVPDAAIKHLIVISDGDPSGPSQQWVQALINQGVTISTVAVGAHGPAESQKLANLATPPGGKYYAVNNPRNLPRIFQREARRVARPLVHENERGFRPQVNLSHQMIAGIDRSLPPITGFVLTTRKVNPLVETVLVSPEPAAEENNTILAGWTYGLGKAVAFTTDTGSRWAKSWANWSEYDRLFGQMVRWSMRLVDESDKFTVASEVADGRAEVVITALDKDDEFLNFLNMTGTVVGPDLKPIDFAIEQKAPGRYVGSFPVNDSGSYLMAIDPGAGRPVLRRGVNVPYSDEFRDRATNESLLRSLAALEPKDGPPGEAIEAPARGDDLEALAGFNPFRHDLPKAESSQPIWHLAVLVACLLFFADIFLRRVQVSFLWLAPAWGWVRVHVLRREMEAAPSEYIERLRARKQEITTQVEQRRAAARFEESAEPVPEADEILEVEGEAAAPPPSRAPAPTITPEEPAEESYTERLLKAKRKAWQDREKK